MWRRSIVLLACIMSLIMVPAVKAADEAPCVKGLAAADCELLTAAAANIDKLTTFELNYELTVAFTGTPNGDVTAAVKGHGPVDLTHVTNTDARTVVNNLNMATALEVTGSGLSEEIAASAELRITQGTLYFFVAENRGGKQWYKIILSKLLQSVRDNPDLGNASMVVLPGWLMGEAVKNENGTGIRTPGPSLDGKAIRLYSLNYEGAVLFGALPTVQQQLIINQIMTPLLNNLPAEQRAKLENNKAFKQALERVIKDAKLSIGWLVDPSGKMIRGFNIEIHIKLDAAIGRLFSREFAAGITLLDLKLLVTYTKLGQKVEVEVPSKSIDLTDAIEIPSESA